MADQLDGRAVHEAVARAAGLRDRSARHRRVWRIAPAAAAIFLGVAVAGRLSGWPVALTLACGAGLAAALAGYALIPRRTDAVTDREAAALDDRAELRGELRSAHWFAAQGDASAWVTYHLSRARDRIRDTPWVDLYSVQRMPRAYAVTAILAATAVFVAISGPTTRAALAPGIDRGSGAHPGRALTADEIERQLAALLATLEESARTADGRPITADEIRKLLEAVRESQRQNAGRPGAKIDEALHEKLDRVSQMQSLDQEVRDALQDLKQALAASRDQKTKPEKGAGESGDQKGAPSGAAQQSSAGNQDKPSAQMLSDSQPGAGYGVVAMTNDPGAPPREPGLGMGGGDGGSPNSGVMVELGAALRRETIESGAGEAAGDPATDLRHKTDRGKASVAFTRGAAAAERGRAGAVRVVPEARRPAARAYFQRKR